MNPDTLALAHQIATALTVGSAAGWLVFHFWPRRDGATAGCAHCPARDALGGPAPSSGRAVRSAHLRVID